MCSTAQATTRTVVNPEDDPNLPNVMPPTPRRCYPPSKDGNGNAQLESSELCEETKLAPCLFGCSLFILGPSFRESCRPPSRHYEKNRRSLLLCLPDPEFQTMTFRKRGLVQVSGIVTGESGMTR